MFLELFTVMFGRVKLVIISVSVILHLWIFTPVVECAAVATDDEVTDANANYQTGRGRGG